VVLFEPRRDDAEMFFANVFNYSERKHLSEHAYQRTRAELRRRYAELQPIFARHGVTIDKTVLADETRTLSRPDSTIRRHRAVRRSATAGRLNHTLDRLEALLRVRAEPASG
jgi:hypothetical protein